MIKPIPSLPITYELRSDRMDIVEIVPHVSINVVTGELTIRELAPAGETIVMIVGTDSANFKYY